mmetsp:Transcript_52239/g.162234  ORF Transcript_52239/g.162234 Transcript_52239/m.162234 type:complete len:248 (+) Transcript_52239:1045-1788(+)
MSGQTPLLSRQEELREQRKREETSRPSTLSSALALMMFSATKAGSQGRRPLSKTVWMGMGKSLLSYLSLAILCAIRSSLRCFIHVAQSRPDSSTNWNFASPPPCHRNWMAERPMKPFWPPAPPASCFSPARCAPLSLSVSALLDSYPVSPANSSPGLGIPLSLDESPNMTSLFEEEQASFFKRPLLQETGELFPRSLEEDSFDRVGFFRNGVKSVPSPPPDLNPASRATAATIERFPPLASSPKPGR